jgi:hypothetical protein
LILAVPALYFLMSSRDDLFLKDLCPSTLFDSGDLEYLSSVEPVVGLSLHCRDFADRHLDHGDVGIARLHVSKGRHGDGDTPCRARSRGGWQFHGEEE